MTDNKDKDTNTDSDKKTGKDCTGDNVKDIEKPKMRRIDLFA